ncbi:MAG: sigma-70 family RNA polymerase sigma factor [Verrucomicrobiae bacterium]|nr:sigma-70 family RNA polymerase sigma factor [Verrucomicrobiae bacterium]
MRTDHELLGSWVAARDQAAFAALVERHGGAVYASALRRTGSPDLAQEAVQAVFILLDRKARTLGPNVILSGWLFRAARLVTLDLIRAERRRRQRETQACKMHEADQSPLNPDGTWTRWREMAPHLDECLNRLGEADRHAVLLRFFENRSLREVGGALGIAEDAARKRITRALARLQSLLLRQGARIEPEALPAVLEAHAPAALPAGVAGATLSAVLGSGGGPQISALATAAGRALDGWAWKAWLTAAVLSVGGGLGWGLAGGVDRPGVPTSSPSAPAHLDDYRPAGFPRPEPVHDFLLSLQQGLLTGHHDRVLGLIRYPLRVNGPEGTRIVSSPEELRAAFASVFPPDLARAILKSPRTQLYCDSRGVMIGSGQAWIVAHPAGRGDPEPRLGAINLD